MLYILVKKTDIKIFPAENNVKLKKLHHVLSCSFTKIFRRLL